MQQCFFSHGKWGSFFLRFGKFLRSKRHTSLADDRTGHDLDETSPPISVENSREFSYLSFLFPISKSLQKVPAHRCRCTAGVATAAAVDGRADGEKKTQNEWLTAATASRPGRPSRATRRDRTAIIGGLAIHAAGRSARDTTSSRGARGRGFGGRPAARGKGKEPPRLTPHRCHAPTHSPAAGRAVAYPPGLALGGCLVDAMSFSHRSIRGRVMSRG